MLKTLLVRMTGSVVVVGGATWMAKSWLEMEAPGMVRRAIGEERAIDEARMKTARLPPRRGATSRSVAYREYGSPTGVPVVLLHSAGGSRLDPVSLGLEPCDIALPSKLEERSAPDTLRGESAASRAGVRVIAVDRAGYGGSGGWTEVESMQEFSADLVALADELNLERFSLIGLDVGGAWALGASHWLARTNRLDSVIVVNVPGPFALTRGDGTTTTTPSVTETVNEGDKTLVVGPFLGKLFRFAPVLAHVLGLFLRRSFFSDPVEAVRQSIASGSHGADTDTLRRLNGHALLAASSVESLRPGIDGIAIDNTVLFGHAWDCDPTKSLTKTHLWVGSKASATTLDTARWLQEAGVQSVHREDGAGEVGTVVRGWSDMLRQVVEDSERT
jgi:pimeloyl-ACP methyl ester carboxylesterase